MSGGWCSEGTEGAAWAAEVMGKEGKVGLWRVAAEGGSGEGPAEAVESAGELAVTVELQLELGFLSMPDYHYKELEWESVLLVSVIAGSPLG